MAMVRLQTPAARSKLAAGHDPYYFELRRGLHIGYYKGAAAATWVMRERRQRRYAKRTLGLADDDMPADGAKVLTWAQAQAKALASDRPTVSVPGHYTVAQAAEAYFAVRDKQSDASQDKIKYGAFIRPKLGDKVVGDLTTGDVQRWLADQVKVTEPRDARRKAQATANRRYTVLRAILNNAYRTERNKVPSADAWRAVRPYQNVDEARKRFLSTDEAVALLRHLAAPEHARPKGVTYGAAPLRELAHAALYTGLRLGELLALRVADVQDGLVHVRHSKSGRSRHVPLNGEGAKFFAALAGDREGQAPMFATLEDGKALRIRLSRAMREACQAAGINPPAVFHDLRRSYGSLMLNAGASMDDIRVALGHADGRMTARVYAHRMQETLADSIKAHLPSFALDAPKKSRKKK